MARRSGQKYYACNMNIMLKYKYSNQLIYTIFFNFILISLYTRTCPNFFCEITASLTRCSRILIIWIWIFKASSILSINCILGMSFFSLYELVFARARAYLSDLRPQTTKHHSLARSLVPHDCTTGDLTWRESKGSLDNFFFNLMQVKQIAKDCINTIGVDTISCNFKHQSSILALRSWYS